MKRFFTYKLLLFVITGLILVFLGLTVLSVVRERAQDKARLAYLPTLNAMRPTQTPESISTPKPPTPTVAPSPTATVEVSLIPQFSGTIFLPFIEVPERTP